MTRQQHSSRNAQRSVYLALGTNIGDRSANIAKAIKLLEEELGCCPSAQSSIIETAASGFVGDDFLNCVLRYDCHVCDASTDEEQALALLDAVKRIERLMGRDSCVRYDSEGRRIYSSRIIDIDIIFFGITRICNPQLIIPHPLAAERDFVMIPLREVAQNDVIMAFQEIFGNK